MKIIQIAIFLFFICGLSMALAANYQNWFSSQLGYPDHFNADVDVKNDFRISTSSSNVLSGNPADLATGSIVCPGTVISVIPKTSSTIYKVSSIYSPYPPNAGAPLACSGSSSTHEIYWLPTGTYDSVKSKAQSNNDVSTSSSDLNPLGGAGSFYNECMTFDDGAKQYLNALGGARIFGKATVTYRDGSTIFHTTSIGGSTTGTRTLTSTGAHTISSSLSNADTMPIVNPKTTGVNFRLYYFSYNSPALTGSTSKTINVENRQNSIDFVSSDPAVPVILQPGEQILFSVLIENDGGVPTTVTGVTSTNPQISAIPFDTSLCSGPFASITEPCNGGNGFNQQINVGPTNARNLWMWLNSSATAPASTTLRFTHTTAYAVCNAQTTQTDFNLNPSGGQVVRCVVTPAVANVKQQQLYDFTVQCFDSANTQIPCIGNSWAFSGLAGWIPVATNTGATAGTHSPVGSTGRLVYTTGTVSCASNLTVNASTESIDVQPPSANLKQNQTQGFTATCTAGGNPSACTGNQWDPYSTLIGSLSGSSANGTTYTATVDNVTTQLYAVAFGLNPTNPPYDWADITVGSGGSNGGGDDKNGESQYCIIVNSTLYAGMVNPFYVLCKTTNGAIVSCQSAGKSPIWIFGASSYTNNPQGILLTASDTGKTLRAQVAPNEYCDLELDVRDNPYACIMYS